VYQGTLDEEDLKLMSPPLSDEELENPVGSLWLPVPRRGIKQKGKCRLIDDYTAYHVNALVTTLNKLDLMGVDGGHRPSACLAAVGRLHLLTQRLE
jgi:hypothetical protein